MISLDKCTGANGPRTWYISQGKANTASCFHSRQVADKSQGSANPLVMDCKCVLSTCRSTGAARVWAQSSSSKAHSPVQGPVNDRSQRRTFSSNTSGLRPWCAFNKPCENQPQPAHVVSAWAANTSGMNVAFHRLTVPGLRAFSAAELAKLGEGI